MPSYISHSQGEMFVRCQAQYYYRYLEGLKVPPSGPLHFGITFDTGLTTNYEQKIESDKDMSKDDVTDAYLEAFDAGKDNVEWQPTEDPIMDFREKGIKLVQQHMTQYAPWIHPHTVQDKILIDLPKMGMQIMTVSDLTTRDGGIFDYKTTGKSPDKAKDALGNPTGRFKMSYAHILQASLYNKTYLAKHGRDPLFHRNMYHVRTKIPKIVEVDVVVSPEQEKFALAQLHRIKQAIENAKETKLWIPNRGHMMCSKKMCGYWDICLQQFGPNEEIAGSFSV